MAFQFACENGRIVLCLKNHEWNKSAISSVFKQVASSGDFVSTWEAEMISNSQGGSGTSDRQRSEPVLTLGDRSTRKRSATSADVSPGLCNTEEILGGPPSSKKQCDYMSDGIDQRIERCRKGTMHAYCTGD